MITLGIITVFVGTAALAIFILALPCCLIYKLFYAVTDLFWRD